MVTDCIGEVGPWGGNGGVPWKSMLRDGKITGICIATSGDCIDSISFTYKDHQRTHNSLTHGGMDGTKYRIIFDEDEELNKMSGTIGEYIGIVVVKSLCFRTNKRTYGPYGKDEGTSFSLPVATGKFVGFFGRCGAFLDSIGAILQPQK